MMVSPFLLRFIRIRYGYLRFAPASHRAHREWLYRRTATAPMNCGETGLTGAEVERRALSWSATEPMEHPDGTATVPGTRFSVHLSTEGEANCGTRAVSVLHQMSKMGR